MRSSPQAWGGAALGVALLSLVAGCPGVDGQIGRLEAVWGRQGISDGRFQKPRAVAIDRDDHLYIVDMSARIQVFDGDGNVLRPSWQTPASEFGKPTGLSIDRDGSVIVADTHYHRVLFYTPSGKLLEQRTIGGQLGQGPGQFGLVSDVAQDSRGNYYVSDYGDFDRIQKFTPQGRFVLQWGGHGTAPGQFARPQSLAVDAEDHIWVADACNHRIQVFDSNGKLLQFWGSEGTAPGQLSYPYAVVLDESYVYICEYGNNRVQKFTRDGRSLGCWGAAGRHEGQLNNPWALVRDSQGRLFVLDSNNHRVQRIRM